MSSSIGRQFRSLWLRYKDRAKERFAAASNNNNAAVQRKSSATNHHRVRRRRPAYANPTTRFRQHGQQHHYPRGSGPLDVARFGLLSIATLPFSLWIALYSYDYYHRVHHCREALNEEDSESSKTDDGQQLIGRGRQLSRVRALLSNPPHQIIVVAGPNESGKSRFVSEIIRNTDAGVTYIQMAQIVDSLSTLTHAVVRSFNLRWLQMRYALVDVLPFAGSEILVMKERFSDRDLAQALLVVTEALKENAARKSRKRKRNLPVIIVDGLGEGSGWIHGSEDGRRCLERLLKWCVYITKEQKLAHVIITGNESLVISLTDSNRTTRGHVKVIGLGDLDVKSEAPGRIILQELPDATDEEIKKITNTFGGFVHDLHSTSRQIRYELVQLGNGPDNSLSKKERARVIDNVLSTNFQLQVERVTAAFAKGKDDSLEQNGAAGDGRSLRNDDEDELDPYLDPLKEIYSEAQASQNDSLDGDESSEGESGDGSCSSASWSQLQLWRTLQRLVDSENMTVPFADLRDDVFGGDMTPLLELMNEDVLGFEVVDNSSDSLQKRIGGVGGEGSAGGWSWQVKPATPALSRVFQYIVNDSSLKERFLTMEREADRKEKLEGNEQNRLELRRERRRLDMRKASLLKTVELAKELGMEKIVRESMGGVYKSIVSEEIDMEKHGLELRKVRESLLRVRSPPGECDDPPAAKDPAKDPGSESLHHKLTKGHSSKGHSSIKKQVKSAILESSKKEKEKFYRLREVFDGLAGSKAGLTGSDIVRLIRSTGEELDLDAANSFIRAWDSDDDDHLDYNEFVEMLLADGRKQIKKRQTVVGSSSSK